MIVVIALITILILISYFIWKKFKKKPYILLKGTSSFDGTKEIIIPSIDLPESKYREQFTLEFSTKTENLPLSYVGKNTQQVMKKGDSLVILYDPTTSYYIFNVSTGESSFQTFKLKGVSNQKWNKIRFCLDGRRILIFLNGTLNIADILTGVPINKETNLIIGSIMDGFIGKIRDVHYYNYCLS